MSVLTDLVRDIEGYPHTHLVIEFIDVDPDGANINAGEEVNFRLQVANTGPLDVRDLRLLVTGKDGVLVKGPGAAAPFAATALSNTFDPMSGHSGGTPQQMAGVMVFRVPDRERPERPLVEATVHEWNTDLVHPTTTHAREDLDARAVYRAPVLAPT